MDTWTLKAQLDSKRTAERHGETWTSADLELLSAFEDSATAELAEALGRTYFAVQSIKSAVRAGKRTTRTRVAASDRPYRGWREEQGDE